MLSRLSKDGMKPRRWLLRLHNEYEMKKLGVGLFCVFLYQHIFAESLMHKTAAPVHSNVKIWGPETVLELIRAAHENWVKAQSESHQFAEKYDFVLKQKADIETSADADLAPEIIDYHYRPLSKQFSLKLRFVAEAASAEEEVNEHALDGFAYPLVAVPMLKNSAMAGDVMSDENLMIDYIRQERLQPYMAVDMKQIIDKEALTSIPAHQPISKTSLRSQRLVFKNKLVDVVLEDGPMFLATQGTALEDGGMGDVITVLNSKSKKNIKAEVTGPGQAKVASRGQV
jgi:flagella basal body P-ring formation protein FlgA